MFNNNNMAPWHWPWDTLGDCLYQAEKSDEEREQNNATKEDSQEKEWTWKA